MQKNTINNLELPLSAENNNLITNHFLNLPDLHFFQKCNHQYRVNRGVYNMIDDWFFEYGIVQIAHRRIFILAFLDFAYQENKTESTKFLRFGHGGLMKKLNDFIKNHEKGSYGQN
ncbi:hypothetical protein [Neobacillus sp. SAB-20_R2A]|uniref:hypothetical protein n=1 Tax=Neobacillus sp. SAB-20_R2A TaxID=3120519 RepID=UPI003C6DFE43